MSQVDAHETWRIASRRLHFIVGGLVATLVAIVAGMYVLARPLMQAERALPPPQEPPAPRLQPHPDRDLASERRREQSRLSEYAWIDRDRGIAQIPIERAMALLALGAARAPAPTPAQPAQPAPQAAAKPATHSVNVPGDAR